MVLLARRLWELSYAVAIFLFSVGDRESEAARFSKGTVKCCLGALNMPGAVLKHRDSCGSLPFTQLCPKSIQCRVLSISCPSITVSTDILTRRILLRCQFRDTQDQPPQIPPQRHLPYLRTVLKEIGLRIKEVALLKR